MQETEKQKKCDKMEKKEFEELIGQELSDEDYEIIKTVYHHHPAVRGVSGEEEVAELYKSFGMTIFQDMIGRARRNQDLEHQLYCAQEEVDRIKGEMVENNYSQLLDQPEEQPPDVASNGVSDNKKKPSQGWLKVKKILKWIKSRDLDFWQNVSLVAWVISFCFWLLVFCLWEMEISKALLH